MEVNGVSHGQRTRDAVATIALLAGGDASEFGREVHRQIAAGLGVPELDAERLLPFWRFIDIDALLGDVEPDRRVWMLERMVDEIAARWGATLAVARWLAMGGSLQEIGLRYADRPDGSGGGAK